MSPWLPVIISLGGFGLALAIQLAAFAYFTGKTKGSNDALASMVTRLMARVDSVESARLDHATDRGDLGARLEHVERHASKIDTMASELTRLAERFAGFEKRADDRAASERLHLESLSRQLANLAAHGPGELVELPPARRRARARATEE